jgi:predicted NBD/HSP70 family sugar kinase
MVVNMCGEKCSCGNYGCIECYSTITSILSVFVSGIKIGRTTELKKSPEEITYSDVLAAAGTGDTLALEVVNNAAAVFGTGLSNFISLLNPGLVVLSGPLFNHSTVFYQACIDTATKKHMHRTEKRVSFSRGGQFKDNAIALGAAALVVEHMLRAV